MEFQWLEILGHVAPGMKPLAAERALRWRDGRRGSAYQRLYAEKKAHPG